VDSVFLGDDFDLNAIPAIELWLPKFGEDNFYHPQRSKDNVGRSKSRKLKGVRGEYDHETNTESLSFVLPFAAPLPGQAG